MFHLILFLFFGTWLLFDFFAVKKDVDHNLGEKKVVLDFFLGFPIAIVNLVKRLIGKKAVAK